MRLVFLGTAEFAVPSLRAAADRHEVVAVVTQPEKAGSRGSPAPRPVREQAARLAVTVLQPARIRDEESIAAVLGFTPDALVVAAYGQILPAALLEAPRFGGVNVHASLLPRWRGAAPVARAILAGDAATGVSIMRMDAGLDTGAVYKQRAVDIPVDATTPTLTAMLASMGAALMLDVLDELERGVAVAVLQDDAAATPAPRLTRADAALRWDEVDGAEVDRRVRALQPWPGVVARVGGVEVRLLSGAPADVSASPGAIAATVGESVVIAARSGGYRVDNVHPPGSRPMSAAAFLRGLRNRGATQR